MSPPLSPATQPRRVTKSLSHQPVLDICITYSQLSDILHDDVLSVSLHDNTCSKKTVTVSVLLLSPRCPDSALYLVGREQTGSGLPRAVLVLDLRVPGPGRPVGPRKLRCLITLLADTVNPITNNTGN